MYACVEEQDGCKCHRESTLTVYFPTFETSCKSDSLCFCTELYSGHHWCPYSNEWGQAGGRGNGHAQQLTDRPQCYWHLRSRWETRSQENKCANVNSIVLLEIHTKEQFTSRTRCFSWLFVVMGKALQTVLELDLEFFWEFPLDVCFSSALGLCCSFLFQFMHLGSSSTLNSI